MTGAFALRPAAPEDLPAIADCWSRAFGDAVPLVRDIITSGALLEHALVAEAEGGVRGASFCIDGLRFGELSAGYRYALCTLPDYRGRGIGAALCRETTRRCFGRGADLVLSTPGSASLERWYRGEFGMRVLLRTAEAPVSPAPVPGGADCVPVSPEEYARLRDASGLSRAGVPFRMLAAQAAIFRAVGGGFFRAGDALVCAGPRGDGSVLVRELLCPPEARDAALSAVARAFGGGPLYVRQRAAEGQALLYQTRDGAPVHVDDGVFLPFPLD